MRALLLLAPACYVVTDREVREREAALDDRADADMDADMDADTDADADADTGGPATDGNDEIGEATPILLDGGLACAPVAAIEPLATDLFDYYDVLGAGAGDLVWVWTRAVGMAAPSDLDTRLEQVDATDSPVVTADDLPFGRSTDSALIYASDGLAAHVRVSRQGDELPSDGAYEVCAQAAPPTTEVEPNEFVDLGTPTQATPTPFDGGLVQIVGTAGVADHDVQPFDTIAGHTYRWALLAGGHALTPPRLVLHQVGGAALATVESTAAEYDPAPLQVGAPADAALMFHSPNGGRVWVEVSSDLSTGWYALLMEDAGDPFVGENAANGDPYGVDAVLPRSEGGGWVLREAGTVDAYLDAIDYVRMDVSDITQLDQKVLSVWVQSATIGHAPGIGVQVHDAEGSFLFSVPLDVASGEPLGIAMPLTGYPPIGARLQFAMIPPAGPTVQWFLTARIE